MRSEASVLHLDLDAFFASVEQRDKPSLRGKPVIVGGLGGRGVVSTASYEARRFGVGSAMPMHEARRRCPHAAFLSGRFGAYREASAIVMALLHDLSPLVEPLSLDEAFVDLAAGGHDCSDVERLRVLAEDVRARLRSATGGLTASVGLGTSKFMAKVASELAKPDGVHVVEPGTEADLIAPLPVRTIPGVGPVTREKLNRLGILTVADLRRASAGELRREVGGSWSEALLDLAYARDDRPVSADRESKSISVEDTFAADVSELGPLEAKVDADAAAVAGRLTAQGLFARTITLKIKLADFTTHTRSRTLLGAVDSADVIADVAKSLLRGASSVLPHGVRLLGVGVAGLSDVAQETLFDVAADGADEALVEHALPVAARRGDPDVVSYRPGDDVVHESLGAGWVWGSGHGVVTVRFETALTGVGPVRSLKVDDPALRPAS